MQTDPNQKTVNEFVTENLKRLQGVMSSYDKSLAKIDEMESYDEQLKHRYLKMTLKQVNDLKTQLTSDIKKFQVKQKEEREKFAAMMKTLETDVERTKQNVDYVKKVIQQQKFSNGAQTMTANTVQIPNSTNPNISIIEAGGASTFMTSGQESITERSAPKSPAAYHTAPQKEILNSVPHQIILLQNKMQVLDKEFDDLKSTTQKKLTRITSEIEELKQPLGDAIEDLKKENVSFVRELERYDGQFKKVYADYLEVLQEYKGVLVRQEEAEKKA